MLVYLLHGGKLLGWLLPFGVISLAVFLVFRLVLLDVLRVIIEQFLDAVYLGLVLAVPLFVHGMTEVYVLETTRDHRILLSNIQHRLIQHVHHLLPIIRLSLIHHPLEELLRELSLLRYRIQYLLDGFGFLQEGLAQARHVEVRTRLV